MNDQVSASAPGDVLSQAEMRAALGGLTDTDILRLKKAAIRLAGFHGKEPEDLVHDSIVRALEGKRRCPRAVNVVIFLVGVMKSLLSAYRKSPAVMRTDSFESADPDVEGAVKSDTSESTDEVAFIDQDFRKAQIDALFNLFRDDEDATLWLMGRMDTDNLAEAQTVTGFGATQMNTVGRRIRRTVERAFPKGLRP